jgi:putative MATE family efflux protein
MNRSHELGEKSIFSLLMKFSIPAMVGMIVNALYNVVDRIFVGQGVGSLAIAGITVCFPLFAVNLALSMLIGIGGAALISIRLGQRKQEDAEIVLSNGLLALLFLAALVTVFGLIFIDPLLRFFGASEEVLPYARDYMSVILWGAVFQYTSFGMNHYIRAEGNPKIAMLSMIIGAVTNIALDPLFIYAFGMGVKGAALATILSQAVSTVWVLSYFIRGNSLLKFHKKNFNIHTRVLIDIVSIGSAPFAMQLASSVLNIIMNNSLKEFGGDLAISAMGVINSISMMILMPLFGLNQGAQPIIGYNYGAGNYNRVKAALKTAIAAATIIVSVGFIITQVFPRQLISIFNSKDAELIDLGSTGLRTFMFMLPIIGFQIISSNYFQATGKPKFAMALSLSRQVLLLIPAVLILPRLFGLGLRGIWLAGPAADLGACLITAFLLVRELRQLDEKHVQRIQEQEGSTSLQIPGEME